MKKQNPSSAEATASQSGNYISLEDFKKIKAKIGKVLVAEAVADSDKLFALNWILEKKHRGNSFCYQRMVSRTRKTDRHYDAVCC